MAYLYFNNTEAEESANSIKVSIPCNRTKNIHDWIYDMMEWCEQNKIEMKWLGESTHEVKGQKWHEFDCYIKDENQRLLFLLRWS